jgi:hypothetical protein
VITIRGAVDHPRCWISIIRGAYFLSFSIIFSSGNLSLQYVNSTNCMVMLGVGCEGGGWLCGWFSINRMSGFNLALQRHGFVEHVQGSNHSGTVLSCGLLLCLSTFIHVRHLEVLLLRKKLV